jgi:DNA-directed RNA polymerase sigma subunit (sigma70/sigma32)
LDLLGGDSGRKERAYEETIPSVYKAPLAMSGSKDLRRDMEKMMNTNLNDVERDVLRLRLGLDDGRIRAVKEVGKRFKISWKQVRCVEKEALSKLLGSVEINEFVDSYNSV